MKNEHTRPKTIRPNYSIIVKDERRNFGDKESKKMAKMAAEAMGQIESRNYAKPYLGLGQAVYKVALVVGWRAEVLVVLEEEKGELKA